MVTGIDPRPARRFDLARLAHVARVVNIIETSENSLTIARRRQRHVTVDGIEKRRHLGDRFNNMTITIEDANRVYHVTFLQDFFVSAKDKNFQHKPTVTKKRGDRYSDREML